MPRSGKSDRVTSTSSVIDGARRVRVERLKAYENRVGADAAAAFFGIAKRTYRRARAGEEISHAVAKLIDSVLDEHDRVRAAATTTTKGTTT